MRYLAPVWLLLYGGSLLFLVWRVRCVEAKRRALYLHLALWCLLPLAFTREASSSYTILYYMLLLPAPCIALTLLWKRISEHNSQWRLPVRDGSVGPLRA